jgi:hypothetical protein
MRGLLMRASGLSAALVAAVALAGGCDWRDFDDLAKQTPVLSVGAPSGYGETQSFGQFTLAVDPPADGSVAARFVASAGTKPRLAVVDLDAAGHSHGVRVESPILDAFESGRSAITALAAIPRSRFALLGVPTAYPAQLLTLGLDPPYTVSSFITGPEPELGIGVAAGDIGGGAAADYVALSSTSLHVYVDGAATSDLVRSDEGAADPCPVALPTALAGPDKINRAVVVGSLLGAGVQVAVSTPGVNGPGTVSIFTVDVATSTFTCAMALRPPSGAHADPLFGRALAIGDFDHDNQPDLLVGSPPSAVYLFRGPVTAAPTRTIANPNPLGDVASQFGRALAAFDLDGLPGDEALIGDAAATVDGKLSAGNVHIYTGPTLATELRMPALAAHDPTSGDGYGTTVAGLPFCLPAGTDGGAAGCQMLPMIGSGPKVFTYFTLGPTDPRTK